MDLTDYDRSYDLFLKELNSDDAEILEIACGPGNITKYVLSKAPKLKITATDISDSMLDLTKKNCPNVKTIQLDCRELHLLNEKYDGLICGFVLPYLKKEDVSVLFKEMNTHLHENGILYLSIIEGNYEDSCLTKSSDGSHEMMNFYYSEENIMKFIKENRLKLLHRIRIENKLNTGNRPQLILIAKK